MPKLSLPLSPYQQHKEKWANCDRCGYHERRQRVVIGKGSLPADILFIGEAPGESEDVIGSPFVGPAGRLLDQIIARALTGKNLRLAYTNVLGCIPKDEDGKIPDRLIPDANILKCQPRLIEFAKLAQARLLVEVGRMAESWAAWAISKHVDCYTVAITHPAAILRSQGAGRQLLRQSMLIRQAEIRLRNKVNEVFGEGAKPPPSEAHGYDPTDIPF